MTITTVPEPPPAVGIAGGRSAEVAAKIPGGATFRLRGVVAGGGAYSYAWSIARDGVTCGATLCDASVVADNATFISEVKLNAINLFVPPGHLLPGAEYRFQLSATRRSDGKLGYAAVDVTVNRPPYGGSLEVSPRNGTVLVDDFEVKAAAWIDDNADDYPLTYTFYYRRASGSYGSEQLPSASRATRRYRSCRCRSPAISRSSRASPTRCAARRSRTVCRWASRGT